MTLGLTAAAAPPLNGAEHGRPAETPPPARRPPAFATFWLRTGRAGGRTDGRTGGPGQKDNYRGRRAGRQGRKQQQIAQHAEGRMKSQLLVGTDRPAADSCGRGIHPGQIVIPCVVVGWPQQVR